MIKHYPPIFANSICEIGRYDELSQYRFVKWVTSGVMFAVSIFIGGGIYSDLGVWWPMVTGFAASAAWLTYCSVYHNYSYARLDANGRDVLESFWKLDKETRARFPGFEQHVWKNGASRSLWSEITGLLDSQETHGVKAQLVREREREYIQAARQEREITTGD